VKKKYKIPKGKITYSDLNKPAKPFFSKRYRITGKPDYILKKNKHFIPVEMKASVHDKPQKNHIFQLAGYCHLLEENYGYFVPYGILVYDNRYQYKIPFDPKIRFELESTINKMRQVIKSGKIIRDHRDYYRCKRCSMNTYCDFKII
jgi:CRISPR-associated exonuclease Cas4